MRAIFHFFLFMVPVFLFSACGKSDAESGFSYKEFRDSIVQSPPEDYDSANVFDNTDFEPAADSIDPLLLSMRLMWRNHVFQGVDRSEADSNVTEEEGIARLNLIALDSFMAHRNDTVPGLCREEECLLYVEVIKSRQQLLLTLDGELVDSFKVSTGTAGKYETPEMSLHPRGPIFIKYTSKAYPGGNYQGLGNMPYAVFIRGGYAIHGTTPGNFSKLGTRASHGCIRLHPDNAKLFNELVKRVGLENTWVKIME
jgi:hypothetical protein